MAARFRSVVAVIAGFIVASVAMMAVEAVNGRFLYPELGRMAQGMTDREAIGALMAGAPPGALLVVLCGWVLGAFAGGFVAAWVGRGRRVWHGVLVGIVLTLAGIANNLMVPPPVWFWIAGLVVLIPAASSGARLFARSD